MGVDASARRKATASETASVAELKTCRRFRRLKHDRLKHDHCKSQIATPNRIFNLLECPLRVESRPAARRSSRAVTAFVT
jgi:hypothetical protein